MWLCMFLSMQQSELHAHVNEGWQEMNHQKSFLGWEELWGGGKKHGVGSCVLPWSQALQVPRSHVEAAEPCSHSTALNWFFTGQELFYFLISTVHSFNKVPRFQNMELQGKPQGFFTQGGTERNLKSRNFGGESGPGGTGIVAVVELCSSWWIWLHVPGNCVLLRHGSWHAKQPSHEAMTGPVGEACELYGLWSH